MTSHAPPPAAGWYRNSHGQQQWWDGAAWGPVAPGSAPNAAVQHVVVSHAKTRTAAYWLAILLGGLGAHRFYLRRIGTAWLLLVAAIAQVLFRLDAHPTSVLISDVILVLMWLWIIVDLFLIPSMVDKANRG